MLPLRLRVSAEAVSTISTAVKIELIVSRKSCMLGCILYMIIDIDVLLGSIVYKYYNVFMLFERLSRVKAATMQLPCASDINI